MRLSMAGVEPQGIRGGDLSPVRLSTCVHIDMAFKMFIWKALGVYLSFPRNYSPKIKPLETAFLGETRNRNSGKAVFSTIGSLVSRLFSLVFSRA